MNSNLFEFYNKHAIYLVLVFGLVDFIKYKRERAIKNLKDRIQSLMFALKI